MMVQCSGLAGKHWAERNGALQASFRGWGESGCIMPIFAVEVFTPNDFPQYTYVERGAENLEHRLRDALKMPKAVVSISGPSKSGKTVLVERVVTKENLIDVSGAEIQSPAQLWDRVLDWMGAPSSVTKQSAKGSSDQVSGKVSGGVQLPLIAKVGADAGYQATTSQSGSTTTTAARGGLTQVAKEIAGSAFIVLIDDFHYMNREVQVEAAKQIKTAAERGIRICVASVPHRSDDVVRSNPELRGRTTNLDTTYWSPRELMQIATIGFARLNASIHERDASRLANEACGSPQLMQAICLQACYHLGLRVAQERQVAIRLDDEKFRAIMESTSLQSNHSSLVSRMHQGPKIRGTERKEFTFSDGTKGDVYRCLLLAIAQDPPTMDLPYTELMKRVERVCVNDSPVGSSVKEACMQIAKFALDMYPTQRIVEFDEETGTDTLSIVDPYWLFYLRSSPKLNSLAKQSS